MLCPRCQFENREGAKFCNEYRSDSLGMRKRRKQKVKDNRMAGGIGAPVGNKRAKVAA
jgi:hypothetical protein